MAINWNKYPSFTSLNTSDKIIVSAPDGNTKKVPASAITSSIDTLQEITDNGNTTTNSITFAGGTSTGNFEVNKGSAAIAVVEAGGANLKMVAGGATGYVGTYNNTNLTFVTNSSEKMRLTSDGKLGINTSPSFKLDLKSSTSDDGFSLSATSGRKAIELLLDNGITGGGDIRMYTGINVFTNRITAQGSSFINGGNFGIGTQTPTEKLHVVGKGIFTDQVTIPATPVASTDAASKSYVDAQVGASDTLLLFY